MRKTPVVAAALLVALLAPSRAWAWGFTGHRMIMSRTIDLLPPQLKPFFEHYRIEVVVRAIDPDLWRSVGWEEDPNHYVNLGVKEYGAYPFTELPRDYDAAVAKFGSATLRRYGLLPWRAAETFADLQHTFDGFHRGTAYGPITATASVIVTAWERAGRPALAIQGARPLERVRKPQR